MVGLECAVFRLHPVVTGKLLMIQKHGIKCFMKIDLLMYKMGEVD